MQGQEAKSASGFIKFLREKESVILAKMADKRNECLTKLDENERRLISIIPKELLDMNAGEFLQRHEGELDDIMLGCQKLSEFRRANIEVKPEQQQSHQEGRFASPPKKPVKKVIIKKKQ